MFRRIVIPALILSLSFPSCLFAQGQVENFKIITGTSYGNFLSIAGQEGKIRFYSCPGHLLGQQLANKSPSEKSFEECSLLTGRYFEMKDKQHVLRKEEDRVLEELSQARTLQAPKSPDSMSLPPNPGWNLWNWSQLVLVPTFTLTSLLLVVGFRIDLLKPRQGQQSLRELRQQAGTILSEFIQTSEKTLTQVEGLVGEIAADLRKFKNADRTLQASTRELAVLTEHLGGMRATVAEVKSLFEGKKSYLPETMNSLFKKYLVQVQSFPQISASLAQHLNRPVPSAFDQKMKSLEGHGERTISVLKSFNVSLEKIFFEALWLLQLC